MDSERKKSWREWKRIFQMLHGDLWGGNWITGKNGEPALIDPAVLYAIMKLTFCQLKKNIKTVKNFINCFIFSFI
ncbi:fructosamine kinase family protein [Fictibacillus sp. KU28468]|nr:fructosamine kinase family protein [Fictibacillus sp. KU28468]UZJ76958.1 fructosamine kinase family protein [Fictibacillus sp. KU28468]